MDCFIYDRDLGHERVKPTCFLLIWEARREWPIFEVDFGYQINIDILSIFSIVKHMPDEAYLEPSRTSTIKISCGFCKEAPL